MSNNDKTCVDLAELVNSKHPRKTVIAPVETSATSSRAYSSGEQFFINDVLREATTDIEQGDTLTLNTNYKNADPVTTSIQNLSNYVTSDAAITSKTFAPVISITDGLPINANDVKVKIEPQQAGSGTPSPSNVRAISGWSSAKVLKLGKNLCSSLEIGGWNANGEKYTTNNRARNNQIIKLLPGTYVFTLKSYSGKAVNCAYSLWKNSDYTNGTNNRLYDSGWKNDRTTFTLTETSFISFLFRYSDDSTISDLSDIYIQIEKGSVPTAYEPYKGNDYTIDLNGTRYGGTLDVTSGQLTVNRSYVEFDGSNDEAWALEGSGNHFRLKCTGTPLPGVKPPASSDDTFNAISNKYEVTSANNTYTHGAEGFGLSTDGVVLYVYDASISDTISLSDWTTALASNPIQIVYELATPTTVQLTAQQIKLLLGNNTLFADTGDISLDYAARSLSNIVEMVEDKLDIATLKSVVAASSDFADFKTKVAAL